MSYLAKFILRVIFLSESVPRFKILGRPRVRPMAGRKTRRAGSDFSRISKYGRGVARFSCAPKLYSLTVERVYPVLGPFGTIALASKATAVTVKPMPSDSALLYIILASITEPNTASDNNNSTFPMGQR